MDIKEKLTQYLNKFILEQCFIELGCFKIEILTNNKDKLFSKYFNEANFNELCDEINFKIVAIFTDDYPEELDEINDKTWRSNMMNKGYYIAHYFGNPVKIFKYDNVQYIIGESVDKIMWRFCVKEFLTLKAYESKGIHLKAGAISIEDRVFLLISPGSGGKTTFIKEIMKVGAKFLANTHVVILGNTVFGVHSNIRVRKENSDLEDYFSPYKLFDKDKIIYKGELGGIILLRGKENLDLSIRKADSATLKCIMEYFSCGNATYNLKMDILDYFNGSYKDFSDFTLWNTKKLDELVKKPIYEIEGDMLIKDNITCVYNCLKENLR